MTSGEVGAVIGMVGAVGGLVVGVRTHWLARTPAEESARRQVVYLWVLVLVLWLLVFLRSG